MNKQITTDPRRLKEREQKTARLTQLMQLWSSYKNLFKNEPVGFFDIQYFFPECKDGFDIVIANPPYIQFQSMESDTVKMYEKANYETFTRTGDIFVLFYEKSQNILKENGISTYITSNKWMSANYGKKLRRYFTNHIQPLQLVDFSKIKLFESATVFVNILIFKNRKVTGSVNACKLGEDYNVHQDSLVEYLNTNNVSLQGFTDDTWKIVNKSEQSIMTKIDDVGIPLKNWDLQFFRGITTGLNKAFHFGAIIKEKFVNDSPKNKDLIKPLLRGKDIKRYNYQYAEKYIINSHNGVRDIGLDPIDVKKDYPFIYNHLKKYEIDLKDRQDKGWHWTNLRNCAFLLEFEQPKIVWLEISDRANYSFDDDGMYLTNSAYFMSGESLKYLLAILNSKLSDFYFFKITAQIAGGRKRYTKQYVEKVPIPKISVNEQKPFEDLADKILTAKKANPQADTSVLEAEIDQLVYELYGLTKEEIQIVEESTQ